MSNFGFLPTDIPHNLNPLDVHQQYYFQPSDYDLMLSTNGLEEDNTISFNAYPSQITHVNPQGTTGASSVNIPLYPSSELPWSSKSDVQEEEKGGMWTGNSEVGCRIAFRTRSDLEIMDDGFKWRKYGKKKVKNSPHQRNYYKCSNDGCDVKKKVERDREDSRFVITTYDGVHNHQGPSVMYSNGIPRVDIAGPMDFSTPYPFSSSLSRNPGYN